MSFASDVQLAVTWRLIANILLFHGSAQGIHIEQGYGDSNEYSLTLTEDVLGLPYKYFCPSKQSVDIYADISEHDSGYLAKQKLIYDCS